MVQNGFNTTTMRSNPRKTVVLPLLLAVIISPVLTVDAHDLWVAPTGAKDNTGTHEVPFSSVSQALRKACELRRLNQLSPDEPVRLILSDGLYQLTSPVFIRPDVSGTATSPVIIEAAKGARPVLSGGVEITNWHPTPETPGLPNVATGRVWGADAPKTAGRFLEFRQLWVDGRKAVRARNPNGEALDQLTAWDKTNQLATIPAAAIRSIRDPGRLEMVLEQIWATAVLRIQSIQFSDTNAVVTFQQPERGIEFEHPWPPPVMTTNFQAPFFLVNAIEFLDSPGEWFEDMSAGKVYYWPRKGEDMRHAKVFAPVLETLVRIEGSLDHPVSHVLFKGITFSHTAWMRPSQMGHVPLQAGMFLLDACKLSPPGTSYHRGLDNLAWIGRPPAAVSVKDANHISFERCTFEHTASAGLDFEHGTHDDLVEGCVFRDIGGNGIQLGKFSDPGIETHIPYDPSDQRAVCSQETIANNLVTDCGTEDWGAVGICAGYVYDVTIAHNEISNLPYTGISIGWGWTKTTNCLRDNLIHANDVHHVAMRLGDTAGIYTLSAQPGTVVSENYVHDIQMSPYVSDPEHWFYLYLDEGSSGITVRDNWCPAEKFMKNANGPGNVWTNNSPQVSTEIKNAAGLEPGFKYLLK